MGIRTRLIAGMVVLVVGMMLTGCQTLEQKELAQLQGTWVGNEVAGQVEQISMTISGNNVKFKNLAPSVTALGTFKINHEVDPKQIDIAFVKTDKGEDINKTSLAIYKIEGKKLLLAGNEPGSGVRAEKFERGKATRFVVLTKQ